MTDPVSKDSVTALVADLAPAAAVQWDPDSVVSSAIITRSGRQVITIGEHLLDDRRQALFFAAHEAGHITLGHGTFARRALNVTGLLVVMAVAVGLVLVTTPFAAWTLPTVALTELVMLHVFLRLRIRPAEYAADDFAAVHGYSIVRVPEPEPWHWWHEIFPTHPSWPRRQQRAAREKG